MINNARVWLGSKDESQMSRIGIERLAIILLLLNSDVGMCGSIGGTVEFRLGISDVSLLGKFKLSTLGINVGYLQIIGRVGYDE